MDLLKLNLFAFGEGGDAGVTPAAAGQESAEGQVAAAPDPDAEFDALIKGKYKDQYSRKVADTVQRRLKSTRDTVDRYNRLTPLLDTMAHRLNVKDASDIDAIIKAYEEDESYVEHEALERNVPVEEMRHILKVENENRRYAAEKAAREEEEKAKKFWDGISAQVKDTKKSFPNIDLEAELQNPRFRDLIFNNVDVKTAYQVIHQDEIIPQMMSVAAKQGAERTANAVLANGARPVENGASSQAAVTTRRDPSKLTKSERDDLIARAARGEKITFS